MSGRHLFRALPCSLSHGGVRIVGRVGTGLPMVKEMDENVVALYEDEMKMKLEEDGIFLPFKKICKGRAEPFICFLFFSTLNSNVFQVEDSVIEDDNAAAGLLRYVQSGIDSLVWGSCSSNCISRELKGPGAPTTVLKCAPETFNVVGEEEREEWLLKDFLAKEAYGRQMAELNALKES